MPHHLKQHCAGCERAEVQMTKEHLFPKWLIKRTGTDKTKIRWGNSKIPALAATLPLCNECNQLFGKHLEAPVSSIFDDLESRKGISESEAELLVRWMWKITGMGWIASNPGQKYTRNYTLRERILRPIDELRGALVLAVALIENIDSRYGDKPMGVDSRTEVDAIYAAGVFSNVAIMVLLEPF